MCHDVLRHPLRAASLRDQIPLHRVMARSLMCGVRDPVAAGDINTDPAISGTVRQHHGEVAFIGSLLVRRRLLSAKFFGQTGSERRSSWRPPRANLFRLRSHRASCALGAVIPLQHWSEENQVGWKVTLAAWIRLPVPGFASKCSGRKRLSHRPPYPRLARTAAAAAPSGLVSAMTTPSTALVSRRVG